MSNRIQLTCECCKKVWNLPKTDEIPTHIFFMRCNYCIECEDNDLMEDEYQEWYDENDGDHGNHIEPVPDNQLVLPFIFDEIGINELKMISLCDR